MIIESLISLKARNDTEEEWIEVFKMFITKDSFLNLYFNLNYLDSLFQS